ncbi:MAG: hypothetical protein R3F62_01925 [Planctomycetota bacterium]
MVDPDGLPLAQRVFLFCSRARGGEGVAAERAGLEGELAQSELDPALRERLLRMLAAHGQRLEGEA